MNEQPPTPQLQSKWLPAIAATALIGAVVAAGVAGGFSGDNGDASQTETSTVTTGRPHKPSSKPVATVAVTTVPANRKTKLSDPLSLGSTGEEVKAVQKRLKQLKFDPGPVDGQFGELTRTAVWGFEKLIMGTASADATGSVTPTMWKRMQDDIIIKPRRANSTPDHTEVYLPEQMVIFFHDDEPALVSHMSSGNNEEWCDEVTISPGEYGNEEGEEPLVRGECGLSWTPGGVYSYYREVTGVRQSGLGGMWNPIYFNYGIAIHGALNVPLEPASHGCIRIPLPVSEYIQEIMEIGDQVFVFDGVEEPEAYGDQPPRFNWKDPDWVPPTTLPPSTLPPTTLEPTVPSTTEPPTTTTRPATTTTTRPPPPTTTTTVPPPIPTSLAPTPTSSPLGPPHT